MAQTTRLLYFTFRTPAHVHNAHILTPPQPLPPSCLSSEVHSEANSEQDPWLATGAPNRNETVSQPSSQVRGDPTGPETSCSSAETIVSEKPKRVCWPSAIVPRPHPENCTWAPHLRDQRAGSANTQGLFRQKKRKVGIQTWVNFGSRPPKGCHRAHGTCGLRRQSHGEAY